VIDGYNKLVFILRIRIVLTLHDMDSEGCLYPSSWDNLSTDLGCVFFALVSLANFLHVHSTKHVWCVTSLPSSWVVVRSVWSHCRLSLSATTLRWPGTCCTATMLCAMMQSRHHACVAEACVFDRTSFNAWQSVSISTGYPHMMSEK